MYDWLYNCKKYTEKCSQSLDEPPPLHQRFLMWLRCVICRDSRTFTEQMHIIHEAATSHDIPQAYDTADIQLSSEAKDRMRTLLKSETTKSQ